MPTNIEILDAGAPELADPLAPTDDEKADALAYGEALGGVWGRTSAPTNYGTYLKRVPERNTHAVSGSAVTLADPSIVLIVQATAGSYTGPMVLMNTGAPASEQCRVTYSTTTGRATLTFNAGDGITEVAVTEIPNSAELLDHLASEK